MPNLCELKAKLRRLLRVEREIRTEGDLVPTELEKEITNVVAQILDQHDTTVINASQTQRQLPLAGNGVAGE